LSTAKRFVSPLKVSTTAKARSACRRAERTVDALGRKEPLGASPLMYLNCLADLLFVLARHANHLTSVEEMSWMGYRK
jgi:cob(I)alamin adenosyltransferase